jgi:hypothetical protein
MDGGGEPCDGKAKCESGSNNEQISSSGHGMFSLVLFAVLVGILYLSFKGGVLQQRFEKKK